MFSKSNSLLTENHVLQAADSADAYDQESQQQQQESGNSLIKYPEIQSMAEKSNIGIVGPSSSATA
jgi:hypothetical protein